MCLEIPPRKMSTKFSGILFFDVNIKKFKYIPSKSSDRIPKILEMKWDAELRTKPVKLTIDGEKIKGRLFSRVNLSNGDDSSMKQRLEYLNKSFELNVKKSNGDLAKAFQVLCSSNAIDIKVDDVTNETFKVSNLSASLSSSSKASASPINSSIRDKTKMAKSDLYKMINALNAELMSELKKEQEKFFKEVMTKLSIVEAKRRQQQRRQEQQVQRPMANLMRNEAFKKISKLNRRAAEVKKKKQQQKKSFDMPELNVNDGVTIRPIMKEEFEEGYNDTLPTPKVEPDDDEDMSAQSEENNEDYADPLCN